MSSLSLEKIQGERSSLRWSLEQERKVHEEELKLTHSELICKCFVAGGPETLQWRKLGYPHDVRPGKQRGS